MKPASGAFAAASLCISLLAMSSSAQAGYTFVIDNFNITRSGGAFFNDSFSDGAPPPNAPNFANGNAASYAVTGTAGAETGGKLTMNSSGGILNPAGYPNYFQGAILNTNTSTLAADASKGLKSGFSFAVSGLYDLIAPGPVYEAYGIRLTDKTATYDGVDTYTLGIRRESDNKLYVAFRQVNISAITSTTLEEIALDTSHAQIIFTLNRADTSSNAIHASFSYVDGGVAGVANNFLATPTIFNSVNYTLAGFDAVTPVPLPTSAWLFGVGLVGLVAIRRKRKAI